MLRIKERIEQGMSGATVNASRSVGERIDTKLIVRAEGVQIKIEVTPVLRGTVYDPIVAAVVGRADGLVRVGQGCNLGHQHAHDDQRHHSALWRRTHLAGPVPRER
jgi:hypothetical protein